jgi:hypothetical protein
MNPRFEIINPLEYDRWNDLVISTPGCSFFHTSNWAKVLYESYGYKPVYFASIDGGKLSALVPCMDVRSILTGRRGVSLPFTDYCEPIVHDERELHAAMPCLTEYGKQANWKYIEFRGKNGFAGDVPYSLYYYGHILPLPGSDEDIFSGFRDTTRRNIRKAEKTGVQVKISATRESLEEFYRLNCMTRKLHGLPPQPFYFFKNIYDHIISRDLGMIVLASYKEKHIAGAVFFHFGDQAVYKYGASDREYQELRANYLVMWEAIQWYSKGGYGTLCFGKTGADAAGLRQYKTGWGAKENIVKYYRYDLEKECFTGNCSAANDRYYKIFNKMPIPISKIAGLMLYRHVG